ncbi:SDR family NAD(P)-dependent oxidoreductase [Streptomyces sp. NPDC127051]|uniref:SDR family NAD(P)-dependent oxidoreductase n=1 Tax=Streptomyces sp. NPDC127051 TaxID=3347119 RepID=UPI00365F4B91
MTLITTPYGFSTTAADVARGIDLTGRRALVTGASSGLGAETARVLAGTRAAVTLAVRDIEAGERVAKDISAATGNQDVHVAHLDLTDPTSIAALTAAWQGPLHVLVNNAGVMACPERYTEQGWEWQFATNHLGHFALATGLHDALAADGAARIVAISSTGHQQSPVVWDDIHFAFRPYDPWLAYGQSKTANVLFAVEATRRWAADGITANALMPGAIYTNLQRHTGGRGSGRVPAELIKTVEQGAATAVLLATSPLLEGIGGRYFADCNETETVDRRTGTLHGVARYALDPDNARRLWTLSENLLADAAGRHRRPVRTPHDVY